MKAIYIECNMGCAGDMLTAALLELHPDREAFLKRMNQVLDGKAVISAAADQKCGIGGTHVTVLINGEEEGDQHLHCHDEHEYDHCDSSEHHHHHTGISEIMHFIDHTDLPEKVKENAKAVYNLIAEAESKVHGMPVDQIHLHEVGTLDALADVLNVCELLYELGPDKIFASNVNVGSGTVKCAHGILPVPAPATERLLRGVPYYSARAEYELCTPTGAALLKHFVSEFGSMPVMKVSAAGYGTGKKDFSAANVVRVLLGEIDCGREQILELSCNLDDMTGEELSFAMEQLFQKGALDVYFTSIGMKKCRPAVMLTCMCRAEQRDIMLECMFQNTTTLGIREYVCKRYNLERNFYSQSSELGSVRVKHSEGYGAVHEKAEYEDLAKIARETGKTLLEVKYTFSSRKR